MKKFIINVQFFILFFLLSNIAVYRLILFEKVYKDYEFTIEDIKTCNTIIFADSHGYRLTLYNPEGDSVLKSHKIFNFSYAGDSYFDILNKLFYLINQKHIPKTIILSVDRHMLSYKREKGHNLRRSIMYSDRANYMELHNKNSVEYFSKKYLLKYLPLMDVNNSELIYNFLKGKLVGTPKEKSSWDGTSKKSQVKESQARLIEYFSSEERSAKLEVALRSILTLCKQNNIEVVGVKFPLADTYLELLSSRNFKADSVLLQNGFTLRNYEFFFKGRDEYFTDQDHINVSGANELIEQLLIDIDR